jgi:hypothetical protein
MLNNTNLRAGVCRQIIHLHGVLPATIIIAIANNGYGE